MTTASLPPPQQYQVPLETGACDTPGVAKAQEWVAVREIRNWGEEMNVALESDGGRV